MRKYLSAALIAATTLTAAPALAAGQYYGNGAADVRYDQNGYYRDRDGYTRDRYGNVVNPNQSAYATARFNVDANGNLRDRQGRIVTAQRAARNGLYRDRDGYWRDRSTGTILQSDYASNRDVYRDRNGVLRDRRNGAVVDERYASNVYNGQTWQGQDGRTYCRKSDGTTGLLIGGAGGALLGRAIDGGRNRTLGTILGGAAGAIAGRTVERESSSDCR